jgi:hypothetical protein
LDLLWCLDLGVWCFIPPVFYFPGWTAPGMQC